MAKLTVLATLKSVPRFVAIPVDMIRGKSDATENSFGASRKEAPTRQRQPHNNRVLLLGYPENVRDDGLDAK